CIIIEDEPLAQERVKNYCEKLGFLDVQGILDNGLDALGFIKAQKPDLIFLDIEMDQLNGIELLQTLNNPPKVIIISAYEKYALRGYELNVIDYLLKPFTFERFLQAINKVTDTLEPEANTNEEYLFVKTEYRIEKVPLTEILYIEGVRDYRNIQTPQKKILTLQTFGILEQRLPPNKFCRVHKSFIVAIPKIDFIERNRIKIGEKRIPISDTYKSKFFNQIGFSAS
ncbi:MAG: LytTR family DNA-binding domain-containing protein, partial [Bacteroidota bacterium]